MLAWICEKLGVDAIVTKVISEERRTPVYTEYSGTHTLVMGDQPYMGRIVTARVGALELSFKTYARYEFKEGQVVPVAVLRKAVDPCRDFA